MRAEGRSAGGSGGGSRGGGGGAVLEISEQVVCTANSIEVRRGLGGAWGREFDALPGPLCGCAAREAPRARCRGAHAVPAPSLPCRPGLVAAARQERGPDCVLQADAGDTRRRGTVPRGACIHANMLVMAGRTAAGAEPGPRLREPLQARQRKAQEQHSNAASGGGARAARSSGWRRPCFPSPVAAPRLGPSLPAPPPSLLCRRPPTFVSYPIFTHPLPPS